MATTLAAPHFFLSLRPAPVQARTARRRTSRPFLRPACAYALQEGQSRRFHRLPCGLDLEVIAQCPRAAGDRTPLVFVHGSFHAAWCWAEHWLPFFSRAGFPCYALSLRAQGESSVPQEAVAGTLETHTGDIADFIQKELPLPPVLIGHSFGGLIVQQYTSCLQVTEEGVKIEAAADEPVPEATPSFDLCTSNPEPAVFALQVIEIPSDASLAETVEILSKNKILSAPIRNVEAPEDASWMDKYIGIVEFAGIAMWLLSQSDAAVNGTVGSGAGSPVSNLVSRLGSFTFRRTSSGRVETATDSESDEAASVGGSFFETLTSSEFYKNTKVGDISGSFRWAPFLALQTSDTFLTMLLLLSKYRMKSLPVVEVGGDKIENIITQSSVVHMLAECVGLSWFESWGTKKLSELGLPIMKPSKLVKVNEDQPVLKAFQLMREKGVGGLPVMDTSGAKAIGNISIRDVQYLLTAPKIYKEHRSITTKDFLSAVRHHLQEQHEASPLLHDVITCTKDDTIKDIILKLDSEKIHRIYVVDDKGNTEGVITLRDIISKLVHEPRHYFGDFFDGVVPLPANSTV